MIYTTGQYFAPRYVWTSGNQYGPRYKRLFSEPIKVVRLSCNRNNASDLEILIVLSHTLNVPVHYDFDENQAYIEVMSAEAVKAL